MLKKLSKIQVENLQELYLDELYCEGGLADPAAAEHHNLVLSHPRVCWPRCLTLNKKRLRCTRV